MLAAADAALLLAMRHFGPDKTRERKGDERMPFTFTFTVSTTTIDRRMP
jgi:hypothetical protein